MAAFKIGYVLICDDVRKEITGKDILIGVYTTVINVHHLPAAVNLSAWIEVIPTRKGQSSLEVKFEVPNDVSPATFGVIVGIEDHENSFAIATPVTGFPIQKEGQIRVSVREQGSQKWQIVKRINVRYQPPHTLTAAAPTSPPS